MIALWLDEMVPGVVAELGSYSFERDAIIAFARQFDPQDFHMDEAAARTGPFGRLTASGFHTTAAWMSCYVRTLTAEQDRRRAAGLPVPEAGPSPGFRDLRWPHSVFAGDVIQCRTQVLSARVLKSRPGWGLVESLNEATNQDGALVLTYTGKGLFPQR